jgi:hypothetical protein
LRQWTRASLPRLSQDTCSLRGKETLRGSRLPHHNSDRPKYGSRIHTQRIFKHRNYEYHCDRRWREEFKKCVHNHAIMAIRICPFVQNLRKLEKHASNLKMILILSQCLSFRTMYVGKQPDFWYSLGSDQCLVKGCWAVSRQYCDLG